LPNCTMQSPSTTIGDIAVWKRGQEPEKSSLRHNIFPLSASRQETVPQTPRVRILPSANEGELRGPPCWESGPFTAGAAYLSFQISFPVAASKQRVTSSPSSRVKR